MSITILTKNLFGAAIVAPYLLAIGTAVAAPQLAERREPLSALDNLDPTAVSLPRAIAAVEAKAGGKVMDIRLEGGGSKPVYDAVVVTSDKVGMARISAQTGTASGIDDGEFSIRSLKWEQRREVTSFEKAATPLSTAIETVEQIAGAPAIDAGFAKPLTPTNDVLAYNVEFVKGGQVHRVAVDAATGQVIADPGAMGLGDRDPGQFLPAAPDKAASQASKPAKTLE
jgi:uncharacterized membrane protein YkoI